MDDNTLQFLKELGKQIEGAIPKIRSGIEYAVQSYINNPTVMEIKQAAVRAKERIPDTLLSFVAVVDSYRQPFLDNIKNVIPVLQQFAKAVKAASPAAYLGNKQFVWWKKPSKELIEEIKACGDNDKAYDAVLENWIQEYDPSEAIEKLRLNTHLSILPVFQQSMIAYENGNYDVTVLGLTASFDKILSICSGLSTHKIDKRVKELTERLESMDYEDIKLSDEDLSDYYLLVTYNRTVDSFNKTISFDDPEPVELNRHWIMHGRTEKHMTKVDCNKLINLLYGTILIAEMIGEEV